MTYEIDALIYNTPTNNSLRRMSSKLLEKYKNDREKTVMIMNQFKKRKELLNKGLDTIQVYTFTPDNRNTLSKGKDFLIKRKQSISNFVRNKYSTKNENTYGSMWVNKKVVAKRPFTFMNQKVKGIVPLESSKTFKETHKQAKFIVRALERHDDIKIKFVVITPSHGGAVFF
jgi:hypothetical protein